jgi:hypothetical protein
MTRIVQVAVLLMLPAAALIAAMLVTREIKTWKHPRIEVAEMIDFGPQDFGRHIEAPVSVKNSGRSPLVLSNFRTSCGCLAVTRKDDEETVLRELTIPPGEQTEIHLRTSIRGEVGQMFTNHVEFNTNDPMRRIVAIQVSAKIEGNIVAVPSIVQFGTLARRETRNQKFEIHDRGHHDCSIRAVTSDCPSLISATWVNDDRPASPGNALLGRVIGTVELQICAPDQPRRVDGHVTVEFSGAAAPLTIDVNAVVPQLVALSPSVLVLPRQVDGRLTYSAGIECRSECKSEIRVELGDVSPGLYVSPAQLWLDQERRQGRLEITWKREQTEWAAPATRLFNLRIISDGRTDTIPVRVFCHSPQ